MATTTTNYGLSKPDDNDQFSAFRTSYNNNMDIIDQNLGGGGGASALSDLSDVSLTTPVTGDALIYDGAEWANTPLADVATSGDYTDLINTPSLATVATTGDYGDLLNTPSLATVATSGLYSDLSGTPNLATVATSGSYTDLSNKPTIPTALSDLTDDSTHRVVTDTQISTWNGKSDFSGSYNDLTDKPTIPSGSYYGTCQSNTASSQTKSVVVSNDQNFTRKKGCVVAVMFYGTNTYNSSASSPAMLNVNNTGNIVIYYGNDVVIGNSVVALGERNYVNYYFYDGTYWVWAGRSADNGSAHTIVNESGTALADEPNLQFTDGLTATDDSVNTKTKVGVDTTFTESATRTNIASGDSLATIFGKIKKFFTDLKTVAFTGAYSDLSGTPTIPTVNNGTLTIQKNGTNVQTFSANQSGNATANITVPTKVSELSNDINYGVLQSQAMGGRRYCQVLIPKSSFGSYTRYPLIFYTVAGGALRAYLCAIRTEHNQLYINAELMAGLAFANAPTPTQVVGDQTYYGITFDFGGGVYDSVKVLSDMTNITISISN